MSSPLIDWVRNLPTQALDTVAKVGEPIQHGVEKVEGFLGMPTDKPVQAAESGPGLMTENAMAGRKAEVKPRVMKR